MNRITEREERASSQQRIVSTSPDGKTGSSVEVVLRKRIDDLSQAIRDKNIERLLAFYAADVVVFDVRPPLDTRGADAYRKNFERWFGAFEGPLGFDLKDLRIVPGEGAAFCHYLSQVTGTPRGARETTYWIRGTTCFECRDGEWLISHEHISVPKEM